MFLNKLDENEKRAFLALALKIQNIDGKITSGEIRIIKEFCQEMNIPADLKIKYSLVDIVNVFSKSSVFVKKAVIFEALGLAYTDGKLDDKENEIISTIAKSIGLTDDVVDKLDEYILKYIVFVEELSEVMESNYIG